MHREAVSHQPSARGVSSVRRNKMGLCLFPDFFVFHTDFLALENAVPHVFPRLYSRAGNNEP